MVEKTINIFISYAHEDEDLRQALENHLSSLVRQGLIRVWHDQNINAGTDWKQAINIHLNKAQIILLLISSDFMASDRCCHVEMGEMARAIEQYLSHKTQVIPILLRPAPWRGTPIEKFRVLPSNAEPVVSQSWRSQDDAFLNVVNGIERYIDDLRGLPTRAIRPSDWERFSKNAKIVLGLAKEEALRFHHHSIGTKHLLLGFLRGQGVAGRVLKNLGVELDKVRQIVENSTVLGEVAENGAVNLTPHAKKVIELAADEAHRLGHRYIGTEHLLLGLIREGEGTAAAILTKHLGVSLGEVRTYVLQQLPG